jgi:peroxiredoxin
MMPLNTRAPDFSLPEVVSGKTCSLQQLAGKEGTVIMFICNHCPFVRHVQAELVKLANDYLGKGITFIAINSNDAETFPTDNPEKMREVAMTLNYPFPYLFDETQEVAKAYQAACTPDFFLFDANLSCLYRGQLDDSRPNNAIPVTGHDLRTAIDHLLAKTPIDANQKPSMGCNIKWR